MVIELEYILGYKEESDNTKRMLFRQIINEHHKYKKYSDYVGRTLNYFVKKNDDIIGCVGVGSGVLALKHRDDYIGWDKKQRLKNLRHIANNYRFCMIEQGYGSQVLSLLAREAKKHWMRKFGDRLVLLETMVQPPFTGVVYKAAGWDMLGMTKGLSFKSRPSKSLLLKGSKKRAALVAKNNYEKGNYKYCGDKQYQDTKKVTPKYIFVKPIYKNWKDILNRD
tara:strand:+ start:68 stop:736 length:669 start_codon:yes stop_codon:yes gene_type:complete